MRISACLRLALTVSIGFVAGGCGESRHVPSGPSPLATASTSSSTNSTASSVSRSTQLGGWQATSAADNGDVEGEGRVTNLVAGTICPTKQFVVEGITVKTTAATSFEGGTCLDIQPGTKVEAKGTRQAERSVLASRIKIKEREIETVEGEGRIASVVSGTICPARVFVVDSVTVTTDAATVYERGTCADLQPGLHVHVRGIRRANETVLASLVRVQD